MMNEFQFPALRPVVTRAFAPTSEEDKQAGVVALFSMNLVDGNSRINIVLNDFLLFADDKGRFTIESASKEVPDESNPGTNKILYHTSFFPKLKWADDNMTEDEMDQKDKDQVRSRCKLTDYIASMVLAKLAYFKTKRSKENELSNSGRKVQQSNQVD